MKSKIPLFFYPAQIIFVDDNPDFLASLELVFSCNHNLKLFTDAQAALDYINRSKSTAPFAQKKSTPALSGDSDKWVKQVLNHSNLKRFDQERDLEVSLVIADYVMPTLNGIEFCKKINNPSVKKILLTGHATPSDAVSAFNDNLIHYYINKSDENMLEQLTNAINKLQNAYFHDLTSHIKNEAIDVNTPFFADAELADYFQILCRDLDIKEYFYLSNPSRFALQARDGSQSLCLIYTEEDIEEHLRILEEEDAPGDLIESIASHQFIPLFCSEDGFYEPENFGNSMQIYPAQKVSGKTNYYCAVISHQEIPTQNTNTNVIFGSNNLH